MWISDTSIRRPVFTVMVISALMVLGLISMCSKLRLNLFPDVAFPVVFITTPYPGASPQEIETLVTKPIEEAVSGVSGLKRVQSEHFGYLIAVTKNRMNEIGRYWNRSPHRFLPSSNAWFC